jgi:hypothetical protein
MLSCPPLRCWWQDTSSNGTFLNGVKLGKGDSVALAEGDRISLVLSVAPLAEQFFTFHSHTPPELDPDLDFAAWPESASTSNPASFNATSASPRCAAHLFVPSSHLVAMGGRKFSRRRNSD